MGEPERVVGAGGGEGGGTWRGGGEPAENGKRAEGEPVRPREDSGWTGETAENVSRESGTGTLGRSRSGGRLVSRDEREEAAEAAGLRPVWPRPHHFLLTALSSVLGLSGILFWPMFLAEYGAAFAVASAALLLGVHLPLAFLEVGLGQFSSSGPLHVFRHVLPLVEGLGWAQLALSLAYGVANSVFSARTLYYIFAITAGKGGFSCADPFREPGTHNTAHCTSSAAFEACRAEGEADGAADTLYRAQAMRGSDQRWLIGDTCYDARALDLLYFPKLQQCWANASEGLPVDKTFCSLSIHLYFNGTSPLDFFRLRLSGRDISVILNSHSGSCARVLFQEKKRCLKDLEPVELRWDRKLRSEMASALSDNDEREMVVDLRGWEERAEETTRRAACLHLLVQRGEGDQRGCEEHIHQEARDLAGRPKRAAHQRRSLLGCLLRKYCRDTWPSEAGLKEMACYRRVLNPVPSLSSWERDRNVLAYRGPNPRRSWQISFCVFLGAPFLAVLAWDGVRRIGWLSVYTGVVPICLIVSQCSIILFMPELLPGALWSLRMDWCRLLEPGLWVRASAVNFFSLSLGKGVLMSLASYNGFHQDFLRDTLVVGAVSFATCLPVGAVSVGYYVAFGARLDLSPERLFATGFTVSDLGCQSLEEQNVFFGILGAMNLFFFVQTTMASTVVGMVTAVTDEWEVLRVRWRQLVLGASALVSVLCLAYASSDCSQLATRQLLLVEKLVTPLTQLLVVVVLAYVYGTRRLMADLGLMLDGGREYWADSDWGLGRALLQGFSRFYLLGAWTVVTPVALAVLAGLAVAEEASSWEAWVLVGAVLLCLPPPVLYSLLHRRMSAQNLVWARLDWGPFLQQNRLGRYSAMALQTAALFGQGHHHARFRSIGSLATFHDSVAVLPSTAPSPSSATKAFSRRRPGFASPRPSSPFPPASPDA